MLIILFANIAFLGPNGISELLENPNVADGSVQKFGLLKLVRKPRETIVGNGCPKGRFRYYGKCKSYEGLQKGDYDDLDVTNEAGTFTPTTTVRADKFIETIETDINLSIVPLSRPDVITKSDFVKLNSDVKILRTVEKSTRLVTELSPSVTTQIPEVTSLKRDVSVSSAALTEPLQLEATEPKSAVIESRSARTETRPTFKEPKTFATEPNQFINELSSTVVDTRYTGTKLNPIEIEPGLTVTQQQLLDINPTLAMSGSTTESSAQTTAVTELLRSVMEESKSVFKQLKNSPNHMLHELSSKVTKVTKTNPSITKSRLTGTHQTSTPAVVNIFSVTDSTPTTMLETTTSMADTVTKINSTFAILEISPVGIKSKSVMTDHDNVLKVTFKGDSAELAKSTPTTTGIETFSNLASEPTSSLTDIHTTVKETALTTTDVPSKGVTDIFDQNDTVANILLDVKYVTFTLMIVISCVIILNWIYEKLYCILYRRRDQENRGVYEYLSKEQESMI